MVPRRATYRIILLLAAILQLGEGFLFWNNPSVPAEGQTDGSLLYTASEASPAAQDLPDADALVGHLFRYQIPHTGFSGKLQHVTVTEVGSASLPSWLYFNETTSTLFGVPSPIDQGGIALQVTGDTRSESGAVSQQRLTLVIVVKSAGFLSSLKHVTKCKMGESPIRGSLMLNADFHKISAERKVLLIHSASGFLSHDISDIFLSPKLKAAVISLLNEQILASGTGPPVETEQTGVELSWPVGCKELVVQDFAQVIKHNVKSGLFKRIFGYEIVSWSILKTPLSHEQNNLLRRRRAIAPTPMQTPTLATLLPSNIAQTYVVETSDISSTVLTVPSVPTVGDYDDVHTFTTTLPQPSIVSIHEASVGPTVTLEDESSIFMSDNPVSETTSYLLPSTSREFSVQRTETQVSSPYPEVSTLNTSDKSASDSFEPSSVYSSIQPTSMDIFETSSVVYPSIGNMSSASSNDSLLQLSSSISEGLETLKITLPTTLDVTPTISANYTSALPNISDISTVSVTQIHFSETIDVVTVQVTPTPTSNISIAIPVSTSTPVFESVETDLITSKLFLNSSVVFPSMPVSSLLVTSTLPSNNTSSAFESSEIQPSNSPVHLSTALTNDTGNLFESSGIQPTRTFVVSSTVQPNDTASIGMESSEILPSSSFVASSTLLLNDTTIIEISPTSSVDISNILPNETVSASVGMESSEILPTSSFVTSSTLLLNDTTITEISPTSSVDISNILPNETVSASIGMESSEILPISSFVPSSTVLLNDTTIIEISPTSSVDISNILPNETVSASIGMELSEVLPTRSFVASSTILSNDTTITQILPTSSVDISSILDTVSASETQPSSSLVHLSTVLTNDTESVFESSRIQPTRTFVASSTVQPNDTASIGMESSEILPTIYSSASVVLNDTMREILPTSSVDISNILPNETASASIDIVSEIVPTRSAVLSNATSSNLPNDTNSAILSSKVLPTESPSSSEALNQTYRPTIETPQSVASTEVINASISATTVPYNGTSMSSTSSMMFLETSTSMWDWLPPVSATPFLSDQVSDSALAIPSTVDYLPSSSVVRSLYVDQETVVANESQVSSVSSIMNISDVMVNSTYIQDTVRSTSTIETSAEMSSSSSIGYPSVSSAPNASYTKDSSSIYTESVPSQSTVLPTRPVDTTTPSTMLWPTVSSYANVSSVDLEPSVIEETVQGTSSVLQTRPILETSSPSGQNSTVSIAQPTASTVESSYISSVLLQSVLNTSSSVISAEPTPSITPSFTSDLASQIMMTSAEKSNYSSTIPSMQSMPLFTSDASSTSNISEFMTSSYYSTPSSHLLSSFVPQVSSNQTIPLVDSTTVLVVTDLGTVNKSSTTISPSLSSVTQDQDQSPSPTLSSVYPRINATLSTEPSVSSVPSMSSSVFINQTRNELSPSASLVTEEETSTISPIDTTLLPSLSSPLLPRHSPSPILESSSDSLLLTASWQGSSISSEDTTSTSVLVSAFTSSTYPTSSTTITTRTTEALPVTIPTLRTAPTTTAGTTTTAKIIVTPVNTPPRFVRHINLIQVTLGVYFEYLIPDDTFFDIEDGNTKFLKLSLLSFKGDRLNADSWIRLDPYGFLIYGIKTRNIPPITEDEYILRAEDSGGLFADDVFKVVIDVSSWEDLSHHFYLRLYHNHDASVSPVEKVIAAVQSVGNYYTDSGPGYVTVTGVKNKAEEIWWSNNTLSKDLCENQTIHELYDKLLSTVNSTSREVEFELAPNIRLMDARVQYTGVCTPTVSNDTAIGGAVVYSDNSIYYKIFIPICILLLLLLLALLCYLYLSRREKMGGRLLFDDEKPGFKVDRHPILLENELELQRFDNGAYRPPKQAYAATRGAAGSPFDHQRVPDYQIVPEYLRRGPNEGIYDQLPPECDEIDDVYARPPPMYRFPPPYSA